MAEMTHHQRIKEYRTRLDEAKRERQERRVEAGLPAEAPAEDFVDDALATVIFDEHVRPLLPVVTHYIGATIKAGRIIPVDTSYFDDVEPYFAVLRYSDKLSMYSGLVRGVVRSMRQYNAVLDSGEPYDMDDVKHSLHKSARMMKLFHENESSLTDLRNEGLYERVAWLRDSEENVREEIHKVIAHYKEIEPLLEESQKEGELKYENN
ncbi:hypothetical protein [Halobacillus seohaensis]|uniref:Uncharacterized protein n=1 Tax=Halobacillus seohaensis TaxID=447421 RepID=A0ABW2ESK0_9BACI